MARRRFRTAVALAGTAALLAPAAYAAQPNELGPLDPSFGRGGIAVGIAGSDFVVPDAAAMLPDGSVVLSGTANDGLGEALFTAAGRSEESFYLRGLPEPGGDLELGTASHLAADFEGRILSVRSESSGAAVSRHAASGAIDRSFGRGGLVALGSAGEIAASRHRIFVSASLDPVPSNGSTAPQLLALTPSGRLDDTFAEGGVLTLPADTLGGAEGRTGITDVALAPGGGAYLLIGTLTPAETVEKSFVLRVDARGGVDKGFGTVDLARATRDRMPAAAGFVQTPGSEQPVDRVLVLGLAADTGGARPAVAAIRADNGSPLLAYGDAGLAVAPFPWPGRTAGAAADRRGRVVALTRAGDLLAVARLDPTGRPDRAFGGGHTCASVRGDIPYANPFTVFVQPGGRTVAVGSNSGFGGAFWTLAGLRPSFARPVVQCFHERRHNGRAWFAAEIARPGLPVVRVRRTTGRRELVATLRYRRRASGVLRLPWTRRVNDRRVDDTGWYTATLSLETPGGREIARAAVPVSL